MTHANAPFAPEDRARLASLVDDGGWAVRRVAERFQCSPTTASRWAPRQWAGLPLTGSSSRPLRSPSRPTQRLERRIVTLRFTHRWGPHRIGYHLGVPRSTVGRVLARYRMSPLMHVDRATGLPVRKPRPTRYEMAEPGQLVHVDINKLGLVPDGGGWRAHGRGSAQDRRSEVARTRAKRHGAAAALGDTVKHRRTRPFRPQADGKIGRFNRTLAAVWAYARPHESESQRDTAYADWLHHYNHHRPHTGLGGSTPPIAFIASRGRSPKRTPLATNSYAIGALDPFQIVQSFGDSPDETM